MSGYRTLDAAYRALVGVVTDLDEDAGWRTTRCAGWTVRDLVLHLLSDAQRALVALHTPALRPADVDAVSYWRSWQPGTAGADAGRRGTRIMASAWSSVGPIAESYADTARAVLVAGRGRSGNDLAETRATLDGLLGRAAPIPDVVRYALIGTGREPLSEGERALLGDDSDRLPLFG